MYTKHDHRIAAPTTCYRAYRQLLYVIRYTTDDHQIQLVKLRHKRTEIYRPITDHVLLCAIRDIAKSQRYISGADQISPELLTRVGYLPSRNLSSAVCM